jgi:hypothetical protein
MENSSEHDSETSGSQHFEIFLYNLETYGFSRRAQLRGVCFMGCLVGRWANPAGVYCM